MDNKRLVIIRKYDYLKRPIYNWTEVNKVGGSFSNSGNHTSFNKCVSHAREMCGVNILVKMFTIDTEGKETLVMDTSNKEVI